MNDVQIVNASIDDRDALFDLLQRVHLPIDGLDGHLANAIVARSSDRLVGSAALEMYSGGALLRSVAVDPSMRGSGLGQRLTEAALVRARDLGAPAVFLLTTTAEGFFPKLGFLVTSRGAIPPSVQRSIEFRSACPATAVAMALQFR